MLTFATWPKPFIGQEAVTQLMAITSWTRLKPAPQIVLFGNDAGVEDLSRTLNLEHVSLVARNEFGTALLDDVLAKVRARSQHEFICLANADVIFFSELQEAVAATAKRMSAFLLIGRCKEIDEVTADAEPSGLRKLAEGAPLREPGALDYFVFPRDLFLDVPSFALGRAGFDNWLVWRAHNLGVPVVDATATVTALHPRHGYEHLRGGRADAYAGSEARENVVLAGGWSHLYNVNDASHRLTRSGLRRNWLSPVRTNDVVRRAWLAGSGIVGRVRGGRPGNLTP